MFSTTATKKVGNTLPYHSTSRLILVEFLDNLEELSLVPSVREPGVIPHGAPVPHVPVAPLSPLRRPGQHHVRLPHLPQGLAEHFQLKIRVAVY